ncbi:unnamed protein product, partial [Porites evermanni]
MILPSISGRGRAFPAESCRYMPCLAISNFCRRWNFHNNFQANCTGPHFFFVFVFFYIRTRRRKERTTYGPLRRYSRLVTHPVLNRPTGLNLSA